MEGLWILRRSTASRSNGASATFYTRIHENGGMGQSEIQQSAIISLRPVSEKNVMAVIKLTVAEGQKSYVAPNSVSIAQAAHTTDRWERAIYADDVPIGYVLLSENRDKPRYFLWRYMIDQRYQRMGFGRAAMQQVIDHTRTLPRATEMFVSYVPGDGGPRPFYARLGFEDTGREEDGELEMKLEF